MGARVARAALGAGWGVVRPGREACAGAGSVSGTVGFVVSSSHVQFAGEPSVLPARSTARIPTVWEPSAGVEARVYGLAHVVQEPPSSWHSKRCVDSLAWNVNAGLAALDGSAGFVSIVVSGSVRSTVTETIALRVWPTLSVATASIHSTPSPGKFHEV